MVYPEFRSEELRLFAVEGIRPDCKPAEMIRSMGGKVISDTYVGMARRLMYAAPHSLDKEILAALRGPKLVDEWNDLPTHDAAAASPEAILPAAVDAINKLANPTSTIEWRSIANDPPTGESRMVFYASERDGTIFQGWSTEIGQGRIYWAEKPLGPVAQPVTFTMNMTPPAPEVIQQIMDAGPKVAERDRGMPVLRGTREKAVTRRKLKRWVLEHPDSPEREPLFFAGFTTDRPAGLGPGLRPTWTHDLKRARKYDPNKAAALLADPDRLLDGWRIAEYLVDDPCETSPPASGAKPAP